MCEYDSFIMKSFGNFDIEIYFDFLIFCSFLHVCFITSHMVKHMFNETPYYSRADGNGGCCDVPWQGSTMKCEQTASRLSPLQSLEFNYRTLTANDDFFVLCPYSI